MLSITFKNVLRMDNLSLRLRLMLMLSVAISNVLRMELFYTWVPLPAQEFPIPGVGSLK